MSTPTHGVAIYYSREQLTREVHVVHALFDPDGRPVVMEPTEVCLRVADIYTRSHGNLSVLSEAHRSLAPWFGGRIHVGHTGNAVLVMWAVANPRLHDIERLEEEEKHASMWYDMACRYEAEVRSDPLYSRVCVAGSLAWKWKDMAWDHLVSTRGRLREARLQV